MTTIKSYTDISQSKKLAEILPIESADMYFHNRSNIPDNYPLPIEWKHGNPLLSQEIPCWSLAALMDVLPYPHLEQNYKGKWCCRTEYADTTYLWEADNPVDACYEMILKLHELKML